MIAGDDFPVIVMLMVMLLEGDNDKNVSEAVICYCWWDMVVVW